MSGGKSKGKRPKAAKADAATRRDALRARKNAVPRHPLPHELWAPVLLPGQEVAFSAVQGMVVTSSHPLLDALTDAIRLARETAPEMLGGYDVAHALTAIGRLAGMALALRENDPKTEGGIRGAMKWARPLLRPDRPARGIGASSRAGDPFAAMVVYPAIDRDDLAWDLLDAADQAEGVERVIAGERGGEHRPRNPGAWDTARINLIIADADRRLRASHHLLDVTPPTKEAFAAEAGRQIEALRGRSLASTRAPVNYVRALLRAWGLDERQAKNATDTIVESAPRAHRRGLV